MRQVDARRLLCPMPVIRVQEAMQSLNSGERLEVLCTDPGVLYDIPAWCKVNGHRVVESKGDRHSNEIRFILEAGN